MDVCESEQALQKHTTGDNTPRPPLIPTEKYNAVTNQRLRKREISSRYKSPSPSAAYVPPSVPCRSPSPDLTRTVSKTSQLVQKRSQSPERKRPSTPTSSPRPATPVQDSSVDVQLSSRRTTSGRSPDSLWPSTMRSLSVSFQSDIISIPVTKKEKPITGAISDRTLRPHSSVSHKQVETPTVARKPTPERKRSPLRGRNALDQLENSKPVDALHTRLVDQHRWPSRAGGKVTSNSLSRSMDLMDKMGKTSSILPGIGLPLARRMSLDGVSKTLERSASETLRLLHDDNFRAGIDSVNYKSMLSSGLHKLVSVGSSDKMTVATPTVRSQLSPTPMSRPPSPSKNSVLLSSRSRGVSPSRTRSSTPPSRGISPSRTRLFNPSSQSCSSTSVLSFIADYRKGKKGASYVDNAHQLRLLHNGYLQWRFANAHSEAVLYIQKVNSEKTLYNVWNTTLALWSSVIGKRIKLQQLRLELKLNSILNGQMAYLNHWASLERDHLSSLSGAIEDLEATTLRLPITRGAKVDVETLKAAICSAVDVMQAMGSSICPLLSRVEGMNGLVSELADVAAEERAMLDECDSLFASTTAMQVEEYSLRTHLIQTKQASQRLRSQSWQSTQFL